MSSAPTTTTSSDAGKIITIICEGGDEFKMPIRYARMSVTIANMLDDIEDDGEDSTVIPLTNIKKDIIKRFAAFCEKHFDDKPITDEQKELEMRVKPLEGWDRDFVNVPLSILYELITTANFLDFKLMLNTTCKAVAEMIKGKTPTEIKKIFGVEGDFTEEEKEQVFRDNPWLQPEEDIISSGGAPAPTSSP